MWEQLNKLTLSSGEDGISAKEKQTSTPVREKDDATTTQAKPVKKPHKEGKQAQAQTSAAFSEILVYPEPIMEKSKQKKNPMPPHLNSSQLIEYLSKKKQDELDNEAETQQKKSRERGKEGRKRGAATAKESYSRSQEGTG